MRRIVLSGILEASPPQAGSTTARRVVTPAINAPPPPVPAVTPGPNAFALRAAEVEAHRLRSNAFYQQATAAEHARRQADQDEDMAGRLDLTPPTAVHPALRQSFRLGDTSPRSNLVANQMAVTKAKSPTFKPGQTPPLKLIPEEGFQGNPTDRNFIEGFHEELELKESSNETGRTPVFKYTPKLRSSEFSESVSSATPQKKKKGGVFNSVASKEQPGSPKKGFLEMLRRTAGRAPQAPTSPSPYSIERGDSGGEALPPKAKAVLGTIPQKTTSLGRSPSKKLGQFARKASDAVFSSDMTKARRALGNEQQDTSASTRKVNFSASVGSKTPARELRPKARRTTSQPQPKMHSEQDENKLAIHGDISGVFRANSLQYFDREVPPTPPAKNTPPHEKKLKADQEEADRILAAHKERCENQAEVLNKVTHRKPVFATTPQREMQQKPESKLTSPLRHKSFKDDTPTRETLKLVGADGRTSPTKSGTYARKNLPTIVKAPSIHSMYGQVFPDLHEERSHEDLKKCVDGLGLDGLRDIPENYYKGEFNVPHSPSIYEDDWSTNVNVSNQAPADTLHSTGMFKPSPSIPNMVEHLRQLPSPAVPASAAQAHQLLSNTPTPFKRSPAIDARVSSRSSSNGTVPLFYPALASDPSRMNLLEDLDNRRGSTSGPRPHLSPRIRSDVYDDHPDSIMNVSKEPDEDLPQLSPEDAYSHPSAKPSPLYMTSPEFSPVVLSTPPRKGHNGTLSASPSPRKTLTPSRNRGRIEDYKNAGSPVARGAGSFTVEPQTQQLPPPQLKALTPATAVSPHPASPESFLNFVERVPLVVRPAEKRLIPLESFATLAGSVPEKVDNVVLQPNSEVTDRPASVASYEQGVNGCDGTFSHPIKREESVESIASWFEEVMDGIDDGEQSIEKAPSAPASKDASVDEPSSLSPAKEKPASDVWSRVAALEAEMASIKESFAAERAQYKAAATVELHQRLQQHTSSAPTSASANADTVHQYLMGNDDVEELVQSAPGGLRAMGLAARVPTNDDGTWVAPPMRESQMALHQKFKGSAVAQKKRKALKEFLEEGESKKKSGK
jgi:hypothetical protein